MELSFECESPDSRVRQWMEQVKIHNNVINSYVTSIYKHSEDEVPTHFVKKGPLKYDKSMKLNNSPCVLRRNESGKEQSTCFGYESDESDSCRISTGVALRKPYELSEELAIINYIVERNLFLSLKGNIMWKEMEDHRICDRTWQSLRSHFLKHIFPSIDKYSLSNSAVLKFIHSMERQYCAQPDVGLPHQMGKRKMVNFYTLKEDYYILRYILSKKRYMKTRGNIVWLDMCSDEIIPNRSWQSLKSRFFTILPHLSRYKLKEEEICNLNYSVHNVNPSSTTYSGKDLKLYPQGTDAVKHLIFNNSVNENTLSSVSESTSAKCKVDHKVKRQIHMRALMTGKALAAKLKLRKLSPECLLDINEAEH